MSEFRLCAVPFHGQIHLSYTRTDPTPIADGEMIFRSIEDLAHELRDMGISDQQIDNLSDCLVRQGTRALLFPVHLTSIQVARFFPDLELERRVA
jgi:hypothetical protein